MALLYNDPGAGVVTSRGDVYYVVTEHDVYRMDLESGEGSFFRVGTIEFPGRTAELGPGS